MRTERTELIKAFNDTRRMVKEDPVLAEKTLKMQGQTRLYLPGFEAYGKTVKSTGAEIEIFEDTSFHAAQKLTQLAEQRMMLKTRIAVLNFANAYSPGGGVTDGAMAQEECLCRSSNLYSGLTIPYLIRNYYKSNQRTTGDTGTDSVIYSPGVTVFKNDEQIPQVLETPFEVDVLTCAAPYYDKKKKHPVSLEQLRDVFCHRIRNILEVAAANDVDILVLGAFGCGAFNNPPDLVAEVFRVLLVDKGYRSYFREIVFPIKRNNRANTNLMVFQDVLGGGSV